VIKSYEAKIATQDLFFAGINRLLSASLLIHYSHGWNHSHFHKGEFPPALPYSHFAQFLKGVNEIREVINGLADEGQLELELFSRFINTVIFERRAEDERVGCGGVFSHHPRIRRRRGFEDIRINAFLFEEAVRAFFGSKGADYLLEGMAKSSAECGALIFWEI
jgi:hypothetical protein